MTGENSQKFPVLEEIRQNLEKSFSARMGQWYEFLTNLEKSPRALTENERTALKELRAEINEVLTKPYEPENKKSFLKDLLAKIENALRSEIV